MIEQLPLIYQRGSATSKAAAIRNAPRKGSQCFRVLEYVRSRGWKGATRDELQQGTSLPIQSICSAVNGLMRRGWLMVREGATRNTRTGSPAEVLVERPRGDGLL